MHEQVLSIFESFLINSGYTREELTGKYSTSPKLRSYQKVMVWMLLKILKRDEVVDVTGFEDAIITRIEFSDVSGEELRIFNKCWDVYASLMHSEVSHLA